MQNPVLTNWLTLPGNLAAELMAARTRAFPNQQDFATRMGWSPSKVSRSERGVTLPTLEDVIAWARACGEDPARFAALRATAEKINRGTQAADVNWDGLFQASTRIVMVENDMIPGPVQTVAYRTALLTQLDRRARADEPRDPPETRAARIAVRNETLTDPDRRFVFVITDTVLLRSPASPDVMIDQLDQLLAAMALPNVEVHVIIDRAGTPIPAFAPFHIYYPANVIHSELTTAGWWSTEVEDRLAHEQTVAILTDAAAHGDAAAERVRWAQDQHRAT